MGVKVRKLGFLGMNTVKHDETLSHYRDVLGLPVVETTPDEFHLACGSDTAIRLYRADEKAHRHVGLVIDGEGPLDDALAELKADGIEAELQTDPFPDISSCIRISDPNGYSVLLYRQQEKGVDGFSEKGVMPDKLGHVAMFVQDAKTTSKFYTDALGFRWSDWLGDFFVFMRCNQDHHTMNFINSEKAGMFHVAFELRDLSHLGHSCDILVRHGKQILWGPGRHGIGHNLFTYHRDPDGNIIEFIADLDRITDETLGHYDPRPYHDSFPQRPRVWDPEDVGSVNLWGAPPPAGFLE